MCRAFGVHFFWPTLYCNSLRRNGRSITIKSNVLTNYTVVRIRINIQLVMPKLFSDNMSDC